MNKKILFLFLILILGSSLVNSELLYSEDFESGSLSGNWSVFGSGGTTSVQSSIKNSGTYALQISDGSSGDYQDALLEFGNYTGGILYVQSYIRSDSCNDQNVFQTLQSIGVSGADLVTTAQIHSSQFRYWSGSAYNNFFACSGNVWYNVTQKIDLVNHLQDIYIDGVLRKDNAVFYNNDDFIVGLRFSTGTFDIGNMFIDDIIICSDSNCSVPGTVVDPVWVDPTPANDSTNNSQVTFNVSCGSDNVYIWFDGNVSVENQSSPASYTTNESASGVHEIDAACYNVATNTFSSNITRVWTYDVVYPAISYKFNNAFDENDYAKRTQYDDQMVLNITFSDDIDLYAYSINVTKNGGATILYNETNESISGLSFNYSKVLNTSSWTDGVYDIEIMVADSHTANEIKPYNVKKEASKLDFNTAEGFNIVIDSEDSSVTDSVKYKDRYDFRFDFLDGLKKNRVFNVRSDYPIIYRENSIYRGHFIIFDGFKGNWVDFENVDGEVSVKKISDYHYKVTVKDVPKKVEFHSIGGLNILTANQQWYKGSAVLTADASGVSEPVELTLELSRHSSQDNFSAFLVYNGSSYPVASKVDDGSTVTFNQSFTSPASDAVYSYYWNITYNQTDGSIINFVLNGSHEVFNYSVFNCTSGNKTLNLNIFNENTPANSLSATVEVDLLYWISNKDNARQFLYKFEGGSSYSICLEPNIDLFMDLYLQYTTSSGFTHRYYLFNDSISNVTKNISMYNYNYTSGVSDLKITARNIKTYNALDQILVKLQRKYVSEGVWRTVQMDLSGDYGTIFFNVLEQNTDYRILYYNTNNDLLKQTETLKFVCIDTVCDLTQLINPDVSVATTTDLLVSSSLDNATNVLTVTWSDPLANNNKVEIRVSKETLTGTSIICDTFQTGSSGIVNCDLSGFNDDVLLTVLTSHSPYTPIKSAWISLGKNKLSSMISLREGSFWTFGFMITSVAFGLFSPVAAIIAGMIGLIGVFFLGIFNPITTTFIIISAAMGIAIGIKVRQ